ncbi:MAG: DUF4175 family protein [Sphingobacteriales bacterium]|nr:DUF4175 family protein [Sphingobacteriales bacterium]MCC7222360.1 DUF4175 family protein [Chitinophagales bacterium]
MSLSSNYTLLIGKLDQFIRKYYINQLIKGSLYVVGSVLAAFLILNVLEYFFYFPTTVRKGLFYGFWALSGFALLWGIVLPLLHYFRLGNIISHEQAAQVIGSHFGNVKDKLLNVLQLKHQADSLSDKSLIEASINQKIDDIKLVPFSAAINLAKNRQYAKYALIPIGVLLLLLLGAPNIIREGTKRLINNDREFEREAPFKFQLTSDTLEVVQYEDLDVTVKVTGSILPAEAFVHINNFPYKLKKTAPDEFSYRFAKLQKDVNFYFEANGFRSDDYTITVIPKPTMLAFEAQMDYPDYTGRKDETLKNSGDMIVPAGTRITWKFEAQHTDAVKVDFGSGAQNIERQDDTHFSITKRIFKDTHYTVTLGSERIPMADSISYQISAIADAYPAISAEEKRDSNDRKTLYFLGDASDDYGIKSLYFKYRVGKQTDNPSTSTAPNAPINNLSMSDANNNDANYTSLPISGAAGRSVATFTHTWDLTRLNLQPGDKLTYFFEVWDNDGVNGSKFARSQMMTYEIPSIKQLDKMVAEQNNQLKNDLDELKKKAENLEQAAKDIKEDLLQKKEMAWEDKAKIENFLQQHQQLENQLQQVQQNFYENQKQQDEYKEFSEDIKEKQEQLQQLMDELMTEEMKELMKKLEEMLQELNKDNTMEQMKDFEQTNDQLQKELDRMLELFKQLEFEQKMNETIDKLNDLAEKEEKLSEENEQKPDGSNTEPQQKQQEEIQKEFEYVKKDMEELQKLNEELGNKTDIQKETEQEQKDISDEMKQSQEQMQQQQSQQAAKSQKSASKKMQKMAEKMQGMQMQMQAAQMEMDMDAIRQLLENLVKLSMDQEDLMENIKTSEINTPQYIGLVQQQRKIQDDATLIEDSLVALSKRVFQLESFITKELSDVKRNMGDALEHLEDRKVNEATANEQFVMTGLNNLALMLDEAMQQMQQQMMMQMQGDGQCNKPGNKPGMKGMSSLQKQLNDRMQQLQQEMKNGSKPGSKDGKGGMSKELAQMAARQGAIRQALEQINKNQGKDGKKGEKPFGDLSDLIKDMEKTEEDLVNKNLTAEMMKRQQEIMNRLLRAAEAERQQEQDNKREAQRAHERPKQTPPEIAEYLKKKQAEIELYKTLPPALKPYYKDLAEKYFKSISF